MYQDPACEALLTRSIDRFRDSYPSLCLLQCRPAVCYVPPPAPLPAVPVRRASLPAALLGIASRVGKCGIGDGC